MFAGLEVILKMGLRGLVGSSLVDSWEEVDEVELAEFWRVRRRVGSGCVIGIVGTSGD